MGLTFTIDHSGRVAKRPTIKDLVANRHAPAQESDTFALFIFLGIHDARTFTVSCFITKIKWLKVVMAIIKGSLHCVNKAPQMSAYTIQHAILQFYTRHKLFPQGLSALVPAVVDWALKHGAIIKKLVRGSSSMWLTNPPKPRKNNIYAKKRKLWVPRCFNLDPDILSMNFPYGLVRHPIFSIWRFLIQIHGPRSPGSVD